MLQNCSIMKTTSIFFKEPTTKHYLLEISRKSNQAHTSVKTHLNILLKEKMIIKSTEKKGKRKFPYFVADTNSIYFKRLKSFYNIFSICESGLIEFLRDKYAPKSIIVFGSYCRGEDTESSDIDIFIETKKQTVKLEEYEKRLGKKIELHYNDYFSSYSSELKNNIINGKVLYGYLEVFT